MSFCIWCGAPHEENAVFCASCGKRIAPESAPEVPAEEPCGCAECAPEIPVEEPVPEETVPAFVEPVFSPVEEPVFAPTEEPSPEETVPAFVEPVFSPVEEPVFAPAEEAAPAEEPAAAPAFSPVEEPVFAPAEKAAPAEEPAVAPAFSPVEEPVFAPVEEPAAARAVEEPAPAEKPAAAPAFCTACGAPIPPGCAFCTACGAAVDGSTPMRVPAAQPQYYAQQYAAPQGGAPAQYYAQPPAIRIKTNRSMIKYILLSIITLGIYSIVFYSKLSTDVNIVISRYDGKKTMHYCLVFFIFSWLTLGIVPLVWGSKLSGRIGNEVKRRGISYRFGKGTFWGWNILGACIIVGPFIYMHKLCKAMNLVAADYNVRG